MVQCQQQQGWKPSLHCSPGHGWNSPSAQSHDCWHRGQRARGTKGFPSLASPHNLGSVKDNCLPSSAAGQAETGLPQVLLLQLTQHPRDCDLHPPGASTSQPTAPDPQTVLQI